MGRRTGCPWQVISAEECDTRHAVCRRSLAQGRAWRYVVLKRKIGMADRSRAAAGKVAIFVVLSALLTQPSYAQQFPETERQKAQEDREKAREARKKADREATDEAYKAMMEQTPRTSKKVDPWGGLRAPSGNPSK